MWTVTRAFLALVMAALTEHDVSSPFNGPLEAVWLGLYIGPTPPISPQSTMADITEANYTGYARQEVVWNPTFVDRFGPQTLDGGSLFFQPTDAVVSNLITGVFLASALTGGTLFMAMPLGSPGFQLASPSDAFVVVPQFQLPFTAAYGGAQVVG